MSRTLLALPLFVFFAEKNASPPPTWDRVACDVPVRWQLMEVDPQFGLTREDATDAIRQAAMLWAEAVGNPLLFQEGPEGIAIRFVFDEERGAPGEARGGDAAEATLRVEEAEAELESLRTELSRRRTVHEQRSVEFQRRMDEHRRTVERWNQQGGAPPEEYERLLQVEQSLDRERAAVNESAEELNRLVGRVNEETERLNQEIAARNALLTQRAAETPGRPSQPAEYREVRRGVGPFSVSVDRELDVYHFHHRDHLVLALARELGRALGLEDADEPDSVMARSLPGETSRGLPELHPVDVERIQAICRRG